jgi:quercetin dioxygenase-like cupin family protein
VTSEGRIQILHAGQLLYLSGGVLHSLVGIEDASALVTIVLRK